jgi:hypothetical protein
MEMFSRGASVSLKKTSRRVCVVIVPHTASRRLSCRCGCCACSGRCGQRVEALAPLRPHGFATPTPKAAPRPRPHHLGIQRLNRAAPPASRGHHSSRCMSSLRIRVDGDPGGSRSAEPASVLLYGSSAFSLHFPPGPGSPRVPFSCRSVTCWFRGRQREDKGHKITALVVTAPAVRAWCWRKRGRNSRRPLIETNGNVSGRGTCAS